MIHLTLPGSIRSKKNSHRPVTIPAKGKTQVMAWIGNKWRYAQVIIVTGKAYKTWELEAWQAIMQQRPPGFKLFTEQVTVKVLAYYKGHRPDLSGVFESVGDCLEKLIYADDRQIEQWDGESRVIHDLKNPRTEVWVDEFKDLLEAG
tara:strand:- start:2028 stop:2468 length:441 start_codon:yes stop_codon:yes gene_type:complete